MSSNAVIGVMIAFVKQQFIPVQRSEQSAEVEQSRNRQLVRLNQQRREIESPPTISL